MTIDGHEMYNHLSHFTKIGTDSLTPQDLGSNLDYYNKA